MTDLGYITLDRHTLLRADAYTREQQDLRETGVIPGSKRIVSTPASRAADRVRAEQARAEFWRRVELKQTRVLPWRRSHG